MFIIYIYCCVVIPLYSNSRFYRFVFARFRPTTEYVNSTATGKKNLLQDSSPATKWLSILSVLCWVKAFLFQWEIQLETLALSLQQCESNVSSKLLRIKTLLLGSSANRTLLLNFAQSSWIFWLRLLTKCPEKNPSNPEKKPQQNAWLSKLQFQSCVSSAISAPASNHFKCQLQSPIWKLYHTERCGK